MRLIAFTFVLLCTGCVPIVHKIEIVREHEKANPYKFSNSGAKSTFDCTLNQVKKPHHTARLHKLPQEDNARFLILWFYQKEYLLSDNAFFNDNAEKADIDINKEITRLEANEFYKSLFPQRSTYRQPSSNIVILRNIERAMTDPLCDIKIES